MCRHVVLFKNVFSVILTSTVVSGCAREGNKTLANLNIIGGAEVSENENSQVKKSTVFMLGGKINSKISICSGVLIAPRAVLTAAHCIQDDNKKMQYSNLSDYSIYFKSKINEAEVTANPNPYRIQASNIIVHSNWKPANLASDIWAVNDLAIIILSQTHPSTAIPAKFAHNHNIVIKKGDILTLAGYGMTYETETKIVPKLRKIYAAVNIIYTFKEIIRFEFDEKRNTCMGDSGGPAYHTKDGVTYLVAINTLNYIKNSSCSGETGSVDLKYYKSWIEKYIN